MELHIKGNRYCLYTTSPAADDPYMRKWLKSALIQVAYLGDNDRAARVLFV